MAKTLEKPLSPGLRMTTQRLQALADGIFAIAMTLLVFGLKVPEGVSSTTDFNRHLLALWPQFWTFGQSFLLLGIFWVTSNRHVHFVGHTNQPYLWLNIVWLMFVALVPFSTSLLSRYAHYLTCALFFHLNLLLIGSFFYWNWRYAVNHGLVDPTLNSGAIRRIDKGNLIFPVASLCAVCLSFATPQWSNLAYLLILVSVRLVLKRSPKP
jgi:uncharacterized membrane protein